MAKNTRLQVMICTFQSQGIERVAAMGLPRVPGVEYLVSAQCEPLSLPTPLQRPDIAVYFTDSKGLSHNRNNALDLASAPYVLIADDDLEYDAKGLEAVIKLFDSHPEIDIATFRSQYPFHKIYPPEEQDLWKPYKGYNQTSFEIALRLDSVRANNLRFNTLMGIGAPYLLCGEENELLLQAKHKGLQARFFPVTICKHPGLTTSERQKHVPGVVRGHGAYISLAYGLSKYPRFILKALRLGGNPLLNLLYLLQGHHYAQTKLYKITQK